MLFPWFWEEMQRTYMQLFPLLRDCHQGTSPLSLSCAQTVSLLTVSNGFRLFYFGESTADQYQLQPCLLLTRGVCFPPQCSPNPLVFELFPQLVRVACLNVHGPELSFFKLLCIPLMLPTHHSSCIHLGFGLAAN